MIREATISDILLVAKIIGHEEVWAYVIDDGTTEAPIDVAMGCITNPNTHVLLSDDNAVLVFSKKNAITYEVHTALLPEARGKGSESIGIACCEWMFENTDCTKIISWVPTYNESALKYSLKCGLRIEGLVESSFRKGGKLYGQHLVGREK